MLLLNLIPYLIHPHGTNLFLAMNLDIQLFYLGNLDLMPNINVHKIAIPSLYLMCNAMHLK